MPQESPEQSTPPPDKNDEQNAEEFLAELMGHRPDAEGIVAAKHEARELDTQTRRFELMNRIFEFSDLLVQAPKDFPDLRALEEITAAAAKLVDPLLAQGRERQLSSVIENLRSALGRLDEGREDRG
jgi:hypothetical protein